MIVPFLKLIRYRELLFVAALQYLVHYAVVSPWWQVFHVQAAFNPLLFALLVFSTVCVATAGFVVNDYFDTRIDELNRPDEVIVGKAISRERTLLIVQILMALGIVGGVFAAWQMKSLTLGLIFVMVSGLAWFHASSYKRQFLLGNVLAGFMAGLVPLVVGIFDQQTLFLQYGELIYEPFWVDKPLVPTIYGWVCAFALYFACLVFLDCMAKDFWNEYGNRELESRTLPVVWGKQKKGKAAFIAMVVLVAALLAHLTFHCLYKVDYFQTTTLATRYLLFGVFLPLAFLVYLIARARKTTDYELVSLFIRFMMIIGLIFCLVLYFVLAKEYGIALFDILILK